uniref:ACB domain-containing protein n=1 Tax=Timema cristinae TaxID=61476 RepID=A0A7R9D5A9_TIMCR|nr:unnamed protein product [Timema cristinae]
MFLDEVRLEIYHSQLTMFLDEVRLEIYHSQLTMSLDEKFNKAAEDVKNLTKRPSDGELLELYSLFKQATVGDNETRELAALRYRLPE